MGELDLWHAVCIDYISRMEKMTEDLMLSLNETRDQLAVKSYVRWYGDALRIVLS